MICKENPAAENSGWGKRWGRCFHFIMFSLGQRDRQKFGISPGPLRVFVCIFRSLKYVVPKFCHHCCRFVGFLLSFLPRCEYILSNSKPEVTSLILGCAKPIRQNDWTTALWNKSFPLPHFLSTWHKLMSCPQNYYVEGYHVWKRSWASLLYCDTGKWYLCGTKSVQLGMESASKRVVTS